MTPRGRWIGREKGNWSGLPVHSGHGNRSEIVSRPFVCGLEIGSFTQPASSSSALPIKFRIDDHPRLRARVLHEQGFPAKDVAAVLASEFDLDALKVSQILFWENYDVTGVGTVLRDVF